MTRGPRRAFDETPETRAALFMVLISYQLKTEERSRRGPEILANGTRIYPDHSDIMNEALQRIEDITQGRRSMEEIHAEIENDGGVQA